MDMDLVAVADRIVALRRHVGDGAYDRMRAILGPDQVRLLDDEAPLVAACWGRRSGKTVEFIAKDLKVRRERPRCTTCYIAPSDDMGVDILWEELRTFNRELGLGYTERWSDREWNRAGGGKIVTIGFNTQRDVERARGKHFAYVRIDEAQLAPEWFTKIAEDAILPTTLDDLGQVEATGTPTRVADGFFFDACHDTAKWSNEHYSTCARNPFFAGRDPLREARERFALAEDSPTYQREWLARWIVDPDELVYNIPAEAMRTDAGPFWGHILGLDMGWSDHDAIGVIGINGLRTRSHLRHMETAGQQNNHQLFARLKVLGDQFPGPPGADGRTPPIVVYDPAGHATKKTIETFRVDAPQFIWVSADKREKVQFIEWLNTDLRTGRTTVEAGCSVLKEALRIRWKRPGKLAEDAGHSDQGDAWLYPWRHARNYLRLLEERPPAPKNDDPFEQHMERMREQNGRDYFDKRRRELAG